jgi:hypothetical protein
VIFRGALEVALRDIEGRALDGEGYSEHWLISILLESNFDVFSFFTYIQNVLATLLELL